MSAVCGAELEAPDGHHVCGEPTGHEGDHYCNYAPCNATWPPDAPPASAPRPVSPTIAPLRASPALRLTEEGLDGAVHFVQHGNWVWCAHCGTMNAWATTPGHYCGAPWQVRPTDAITGFEPGTFAGKPAPLIASALSERDAEIARLQEAGRVVAQWFVDANIHDRGCAVFHDGKCNCALAEIEAAINEFAGAAPKTETPRG